MPSTTGIAEALTPLEPVPATRADLERVHPAWYLDRIDAVSAAGGGWIDADTRLSAHSAEAACLAAGAGLTAVAALREGAGTAAFCAVRPPGHHATPDRRDGLLPVSNIAVVGGVARRRRASGCGCSTTTPTTATGPRPRSSRIPRVLFVSLHQWPLYPGHRSGHRDRHRRRRRHDDERPAARRAPPATSTCTRSTSSIAPVVERFAPTWLLISAGFDAHRDDPLTELGLTAGDYPLLTARALQLVPPGRCVAMLEGGYDLDALAGCASSVLATLAGVAAPTIEAPSSGGPGATAIADVAAVWNQP